MQAAGPVASREMSEPDSFLVRLFESLISQPVFAQTGIVANCRSGGTVRVTSGYSTPGGGRVVFNNGQINYSSCGYPLNGGVVTFSGALTANGTYTASAPNNPVTLQGSSA